MKKNAPNKATTGYKTKYFYPDLWVTVEASTREEADKKALSLKKKVNASTKKSSKPNSK